MRRIARFLEIEVPEEKRAMLADAATFAAMKRDVEVLGPEMDMIFEGGANRFLYKGTNDRWRDVLTSDDVALYEAAAARRLTPDLKRWLERGAASGIDPKGGALAGGRGGAPRIGDWRGGPAPPPAPGPG